MQSLFFWSNWIRDYRVIWYFLVSIFVLSLGIMWYFYLIYPEGAIQWEHLQEQKVIESTIHSFRVGPFQLTIPAESYVILEHFGGSNVVHNMFSTNVFLLVFAVTMIVLLALTSVLERFWYFIGISIFVVCAMALRFEVLKIFGFRHVAVGIVILCIYLAISFYFRFLKTHTSFILRLIVFSVVTLLLFLTVYFFGEIDHPSLHLMITAYTPALVLTIAFIIIVSHEIMVSFVYITNSQRASGNNVAHFTVISAIYLLNVIITAMHEMGVIDWNFLYLNVYLLLTISGVLALWGFRIREPQYENVFPFAPFGAFMIVTLGALSMIFIGQLLANANDAALKVIRDIIVFSHAGFGIIFFIYFFSNFFIMLGNGLPVYEVLYKPNRMPYFTFQFAGLIATLGFVFSANWHEYVYHGTAGFYNYVGDLYLVQDNEAFGMSFYEQSRGRAFATNRANYALGNLKTDRLDFAGAAENYEQSNFKRPTEFSYANEGNLPLWTGQTFNALRILNKGRKKMPKSAVLSNNLGYAYVKIHKVDSANYFLNEAREHPETKASAETNFLAMAALEYIPIGTDSAIKFFDRTPAVMANAMALSTIFHQPLTDVPDPLVDTTLDLYSATYLNNYIIGNAKQLDSTFLRKAERIASDSLNASFKEALKSSLAFAYYHQGQVFKALEILGELVFLSQDYGGKYNYTMGLWALEQNAPELAASYFKYADEANYKQGKFYYAIALTEMKQANYAMMAWDSVAAQNDVASKQFAEQLIKILSMNFNQAIQLSDPEKYQFCRYKISLNDSASFNKMIGSFENVNYKAQALLDRTNALLKANRLIDAIKVFGRISGLPLTDKRLFESIQFTELRMLAIRNEVKPLADQINKGVTFDDSRTLDKILYAAIMNATYGDPKQAAQQFEYLGKSNPFFEEGILAAANFFKAKEPKSHKAYDILVNSIYVNPHSVRLLKAYAEEASRMGYDEYAASAAQRLAEAERNIY